MAAIDIVTDEEILAAQSWLAQHEGIFVEPASAASIAGLFKCCDSDEAAYSFQKIPEASRIVCTVTGHGLKDPDSIIRRMQELKPVAADCERRATCNWTVADLESHIVRGRDIPRSWL